MPIIDPKEKFQPIRIKRLEFLRLRALSAVGCPGGDTFGQFYAFN